MSKHNLYYISVIRNPHTDENDFEWPEKESNYSCEHFHLYQSAKEGTLVELENDGAVDRTFVIDRNYMSAWFMNSTGKTLRSIPMWDEHERKIIADSAGKVNITSKKQMLTLQLPLTIRNPELHDEFILESGDGYYHYFKRTGVLNGSDGFTKIPLIYDVSMESE